MPRKPTARDVACPACGAAPWTPCVEYVPPNAVDGQTVPGGRSHARRRFVAQRLRRELGFKPRRVKLDEDGHFAS